MARTRHNRAFSDRAPASSGPQPAPGPEPVPAGERQARFAREVAEGLSRRQKEIPCTYLYDALGSALFEAITVLPEYELTRADERLLAAHAADIAARVPAPFDIAELGSGSGRKTRLLLEQAAGPAPERFAYFPIDISGAALAQCVADLSSIPGLEIHPIEADHLNGLDQAVSRRETGRTFLVLFLGSCIGNFSRESARAFLSEVRARLQAGDALLIGADLEKSVARMLLAYDDPIGLTAAFNRNVLARLNRELGANFVPENFEHEARWNAAERRVEMHLVSRCAQAVSLPRQKLFFTFERGESIRTEQCHKYRLEDLDRMAAESGFRVEARWVDGDWPFAEDLWIAV